MVPTNLGTIQAGYSKFRSLQLAIFLARSRKNLARPVSRSLPLAFTFASGSSRGLRSLCSNKRRGHLLEVLWYVVKTNLVRQMEQTDGRPKQRQ